jgi:hypothetical protein
MTRHLKINTALFICTAFVFRIVFFNVFVISSSNFQNANRLVKTHFATAMKRRVNIDFSNAESYSDAELGEEKKESKFESNPFFLLQAVYSLITREMKSKLRGLTLFCNYLSTISSHRYLVLQVLRT